MPTTPNGTAWTSHEFTPPGGSASTWAAPDAAVAGAPVNLLVYTHGSSGDHTDFLTHAVWEAMRHRLIDAGWAWVECHAYDPVWGSAVNNWGSPTGVLHYRLAYEHAAAQLNVQRVAVLGRSMGGLAAINLFLRDPVVSTVADCLILNCATQDLTYRSTVTAGSVGQFRVPYRISSDAAFLETLPAIDPMLYPVTEWEGKAVMQVVGDADTTVDPTWHGLAMRARTHHALASSRIAVAYGGDHGASGGYSKHAEMMAFLQSPRGTRAPRPITAIRANLDGQVRDVTAVVVQDGPHRRNAWPTLVG